MTSKKNKARSARTMRDSSRKFKKKANPLAAEKLEYIDYKDVNLLQRFMTDRSKIRGRSLAGTTVQEQRELATAIKNAREMALLPYTKRTVSTRTRPGSDRRDDDEGRGRDVPADDAAPSEDFEAMSPELDEVGGADEATEG